MTIIPANPVTQLEKTGALAGERVLIVDDEPAILFAYRKLIEREGMVVDACESFEEALAYIRSNHYFAVIADMRLAGSENTDGLEILRVTRNESPGTKVILSTGYGNSEIEQMAMTLGACHYFEKPVIPALILELLHKLRTAADSIIHGDLMDVTLLPDLSDDEIS
jgi:DNA-binding NtrC family response regulator